MNPLPRTVEWIGDCDGHLRLLDQTRLPREVVFRDCHSVDDVWEAIRSLRVRGAPAIGIAAAYGVVIGLQNASPSEFDRGLRSVIERLRSARPTAVNLFHALDSMSRCRTLAELLVTARNLESMDRAMCRSIGRWGAPLVPDGGGVITHCNAGALAVSEFGTALGVLYSAAESGKRFRVYVDETRPLLQGSRLTAWELQQSGIDAVVICDNAAGAVMRQGRVQMVIVGADRIAANGDTANKIGTYSLSVLARAHHIPFYVAAPTSTFDLSLSSGDRIPIEERSPREITHGFGMLTAPDGIDAFNPAFDVTPAELITAIITDRGVIRPVSEAAIRAVMADDASQI
jgi:methylthioribose-1-phosphate isomerase